MRGGHKGWGHRQEGGVGSFIGEDREEERETERGIEPPTRRTKVGDGKRERERERARKRERERSGLKLHRFRSCNGGEPLRASIIYYKGNKYTITIRELVLPQCLPRYSLEKHHNLGFTWRNPTQRLQSPLMDHIGGRSYK
jgi:hypothetical protein